MAKKIYVSPSDQGKNTYAAGNTNEEVQCEQIAVYLVDALKRNGFDAKTNLTDSMYERIDEGNEWKADLYIAMHTNAFNEKVTGTRIMCYQLSGEGYEASKAIFAVLAPVTPGTSENVSAHPELAEINKTRMPCVYIEIDFHDVPDVANWIINNKKLIAETICKGICNHYGVKYKSADRGDNTAADSGDNKPDEYAKEAVKWAIDKGILQGDGTSYKLHSNISRQDMLVFLYRAMNK